MAGNKNLLIVYARMPEAGKVKTRLANGIGGAACDLYSRFIATTIGRVRRLPNIELRIDYDPDTEEAREYFRKRHEDISRAPQSAGDLGDRMLNSFKSAFASGSERVCLIGTDIPDVPTDNIIKAFDSLSDHNLVLGPSMDGGYYLLALKTGQPALFEGMIWSTDTVFEETVQRAKDIGLSVAQVPAWDDVDDAEGLACLGQRLKNYSGDVFLDELKVFIESLSIGGDAIDK